MIASAGIPGPGQDGSGDTAVEGVADFHMQFSMDGVVVGHGEVFGWVRRIECPEIDDLAAMGVDDFDDLVLFEEEGGAAAGGESLLGGHIFWVRDGG